MPQSNQYILIIFAGYWYSKIVISICQLFYQVPTQTNFSLSIFDETKLKFTVPSFNVKDQRVSRNKGLRLYFYDYALQLQRFL